MTPVSLQMSSPNSGGGLRLALREEISGDVISAINTGANDTVGFRPVNGREHDVAIPVGRVLASWNWRGRNLDGLAHLNDDGGFRSNVRIALKVVQLKVVKGVACEFDPVTALRCDLPCIAQSTHRVLGTDLSEESAGINRLVVCHDLDLVGRSVLFVQSGCALAH